ncbi:MAG: sulfite exporter TauE/SafE family protein [Armatimonadetes bacterium]|nr:sulfite exporter TauE/SafE family protein [Armatimonadota bacterium]
MELGQFALVAALALLAGFVFGLFSAGGALILIPILNGLLHVPFRQAGSATLLIQAITGSVTAVQHARHGNLRPAPALPMLIGTALSSFLAGKWVPKVPQEVLIGLFGGMVLLAVAMLHRRRGGEEGGKSRASWPVQMLVGFAISFLPALVGIGGGFLYVPALYTLCALGIHQAAGTAMLLVVVTCVMGVSGRILSHEQIPLSLVLIFSVMTVVSSGLGARTARTLSAPRLKAAFSIFLALLGAYYVGKAVYDRASLWQPPPGKLLVLPTGAASVRALAQPHRTIG